MHLSYLCLFWKMKYNSHLKADSSRTSENKGMWPDLGEDAGNFLLDIERGAISSSSTSASSSSINTYFFKWLNASTPEEEIYKNLLALQAGEVLVKNLNRKRKVGYMHYFCCCCCCCLGSCYNCNFYVKAEDNEEDVEFALDHMQCEEQKKLLVSANSCTLNQHVTPTEKSLHFSIVNYK